MFNIYYALVINKNNMTVHKTKAGYRPAQSRKVSLPV